MQKYSRQFAREYPPELRRELGLTESTDWGMYSFVHSEIKLSSFICCLHLLACNHFKVIKIVLYHNSGCLLYAKDGHDINNKYGIYFPVQVLLTNDDSLRVLFAICFCKSSFFSLSLLSSIFFRF